MFARVLVNMVAREKYNVMSLKLFRQGYLLRPRRLPKRLVCCIYMQREFVQALLFPSVSMYSIWDNLGNVPLSFLRLVRAALHTPHPAQTPRREAPSSS